MKILIITVAGMATRFSKSVSKECIKCLYHEDNIRHSILFRLLEYNQMFYDKVIIVGGYKYEQLQETMDKKFLGHRDKVILVKNEHYFDYGSGYSLLLGLRKAFELDAKEIVFAEGDLFVKSNIFKEIWQSKIDVITTNDAAILASNSVVFYSDINKKIHYIFDVHHEALEINEPFIAIWNSGQIWKMMDMKRLKYVCNCLTEQEQQGTNLVIIQKYFESFSVDKYKIFHINDWINCNTVEDYRRIKEIED